MLIMSATSYTLGRSTRGNGIQSAKFASEYLTASMHSLKNYAANKCYFTRHTASFHLACVNLGGLNNTEMDHNTTTYQVFPHCLEVTADL